MKVGYVLEGSRWVPADEYKIFVYVDKIYSDKNSRNGKFGLLGKNQVSGDGKKKIW